MDLFDPRQPELSQHHSLGLATDLDFYESHVSQHTSCNPCNIVCFMFRILEVSGFSGTKKNIDIIILPSKCGNITRHVLCRYLLFRHVDWSPSKPPSFWIFKAKYSILITTSPKNSCSTGVAAVWSSLIPSRKLASNEALIVQPTAERVQLPLCHFSFTRNHVKRVFFLVKL